MIDILDNSRRIRIQEEPLSEACARFQRGLEDMRDQLRESRKERNASGSCGAEMAFYLNDLQRYVLAKRSPIEVRRQIIVFGKAGGPFFPRFVYKSELL